MSAISYDAAGLIPVVAQDVATGNVLLLAYMSEEAVRLTLAEGILVLWSRSRGKLWRKGEESGHTLQVNELRLNCEGTSLLARVSLAGPGACHKGYESCFFRRVTAKGDGTLSLRVIAERTFDPAMVYGRPHGQPATTGVDEAAFERDARELYAAYERLRDGAVIETSRTSLLLHAPDREATVRRALARGMEELGELRGVLSGEHRHHGGVADVILEAGQVGYWAMVAAVACGAAYDTWAPHRAWLDGYSYDRASSAVEPPRDGYLQECQELLHAGGKLCRDGGVRPSEVIAADLAEMRRKHAAQ